MRWLAIANPAAGRPRQVQRAVAERARLPDFACEVAETRGPGDATRLARDLGLGCLRQSLDALRRVRVKSLDLLETRNSFRDGLLDVMELTSGWPRQLLHNLSVLAGSRRFGPLATRQAASVGLAFDEPRTIMADGELRPSVVRLQVKCCAAAARCVVGAA